MGQPITQLNIYTPVRDQINRVIGNTQLVNYGLQTEVSDYRAHVGYKSQHVFVFSTESAKQILANIQKQGLYRLRDVKSVDCHGREICTAQGYAVPLSDFMNMQAVMIPTDIYRKYEIYQNDPTSVSGVKAVNIVVEMLKRRLIALPIEVQEVTEKTLQIQGQDILVKANLRIQVKCDFRAGYKPYGTGNLFLQIAECNPFKRH